MQIPILCYHSHIISSDDYCGNGHIALARDLEMIVEHGKTVLPLHLIVDALLNQQLEQLPEHTLAITFDDGSKADYMPVQHPQFGTLPGLLPVLQQHTQQNPSSQPIHATSFVIANARSRQRMDERCLFDDNWMSDHWWQPAQASGQLSIECHSWNHNNAVCDEVQEGQGDQFHSISSYVQADRQIRQAADVIGELCGRRPGMFAYPYGHVNHYLEHEYLPGFQHEHQLQAAFSTRPEYLTSSTSRWAIPRFVHGEHWHDPDAFAAIIKPL